MCVCNRKGGVVGVAGGSKGKMCVCNREVGVVGVAGGSKGKMCVCNREGGVVGVAGGSKCKMCVCNRGDQRSLRDAFKKKKKNYDKCHIGFDLPPPLL